MARALGLDLGRNMGWALAEPEYLAGWRPRIALEGPRASNGGLDGGTWPLGAKADYAGLYVALWRRLDGLHAKTPLTHVFFESSGGRYKSISAVFIQVGLAVVIMLWCRLNEVECELVNNSAAKLHATHYGKAVKGDMIRACERLGWEPDSEHAADAFFVLDCKLTEWHRLRR